MPRAVHVLAFGIFAMVTSEFVVAGLMPQMAEGLDVTVPQIGYLITVFALSMAFGGPLLSVALLRLPPKTALMVLFPLFLAGNVLAATASGYPVMVVARVVTGVASQAFFGVAISLGSQLTRPEQRGRAMAVVLNGLMLGTLLGLPLATLTGERYGWRAAFWAISALTAAAALCTAVGVRRTGRPEGSGTFRSELTAFRAPRLWLTLLTSTMVIGATFSAFSYLNPILTDVTGFSPGAVPLLLLAYGAATVVGNTVVGRLADRHTLPVLVGGLSLNAVFLTGFALLAGVQVWAVLCMLGVGLVGVTMNPALVTRVQRTGNARPLVNTVHSSFITLGVVLGSALGGLGLDRFGPRAPLWLGAALAVTGLLTLVPDLLRRGKAPGAAGPDGRSLHSGPSTDGGPSTGEDPAGGDGPSANSEQRAPAPLHAGQTP